MPRARRCFQRFLSMQMPLLLSQSGHPLIPVIVHRAAQTAVLRNSKSEPQKDENQRKQTDRLEGQGPMFQPVAVNMETLFSSLSWFRSFT